MKFSGSAGRKEVVGVVEVSVGLGSFRARSREQSSLPYRFGQSRR